MLLYHIFSFFSSPFAKLWGFFYVFSLSFQIGSGGRSPSSTADPFLDPFYLQQLSAKRIGVRSTEQEPSPLPSERPSLPRHSGRDLRVFSSQACSFRRICHSRSFDLSGSLEGADPFSCGPSPPRPSPCLSFRSLLFLCGGDRRVPTALLAGSRASVLRRDD